MGIRAISEGVVVTASAAEPVTALPRGEPGTQRSSQQVAVDPSPPGTEGSFAVTPTDLTVGLLAEAVRTAAGYRFPESLRVWTSLAVRCGPCDAATITVLNPDGTLRTVGAIDERAEQADRMQCDTGAGPSVEAVQGTVLVLAEDLRAASTRWPRWAPWVTGLGLTAVLSVQLFTTEALGSLNLYSTTPRRYGTADLDTATALAAHVSAALARALAEHNLRQAVESRNLIGQAQGMLMERYRLTPEKSFAVLRRYSDDHDLKIDAVAEHMVNTGKLPALPIGPTTV